MQTRSNEQWRSLARDICYRQLAVRERAVSELRQALVRREVPQEIIEDTLAAFLKADLVSDERFANAFVRSRFAQKASTRRLLQRQLRERGIAADIAQAAVEQIDAQAEFDNGIAFAQAKMRTMGQLDPQVCRRRLYGALCRRGYASSDAIRIIEAMFD